MNMNQPASINRQGAFSLVEVMVAAVIFALGLGSLSLMLLTSVHGSVEAQHSTSATMQAASLAELILLNPAAAGHYINPPGGSSGNCFAAEGCSAAAWAAGNLERWQEQLDQSLTGATSVVCRDATPDDGHAEQPDCDGAGRIVVKVFWTEPRHADDDGGLRRAVLPVVE